MHYVTAVSLVGGTPPPGSSPRRRAAPRPRPPPREWPPAAAPPGPLWGRSPRVRPALLRTCRAVMCRRICVWRPRMRAPLHLSPSHERALIALVYNARVYTRKNLKGQIQNHPISTLVSVHYLTIFGCFRMLRIPDPACARTFCPASKLRCRSRRAHQAMQCRARQHRLGAVQRTCFSVLFRVLNRKAKMSSDVQTSVRMELY